MPMPEGISKGPIFMRLDTLLSSPHRCDEFKKGLQKPIAPPNDLTSLAIDYGLAVTQKEQDHLRYDWFRDWWPELQKQGPNGKDGVDQVIRKGLIEAIEMATKLCLPVDCYWLCHMQHDHIIMHSEEGIGLYKELDLNPIDPLHPPVFPPPPVVQEGIGVGVCWSPQQVTVMIHTPPPPPGPPEELTLLEPIKIVARDKNNQVIVKHVKTHK